MPPVSNPPSPRMAEDVAGVGKEVEPAPEKKKRRPRGFLSRLWSGVFGGRSDDYEKRLQYLSKEEASVMARMQRRARTSVKRAWNLALTTILVELVLIGYAIITTLRGVDQSWQMMAVQVLLIFVVPALGFAVYTAFVSFIKMRDQKDQKTLERLRAERKAKIDELKERTNYYSTQQLIQRYDLDPAAKAAAATVLASKLGADSGLNFLVGDENNPNAPMGKSNDVELLQSTGLRNRKPSNIKSHSPRSSGNTLVTDETTDIYNAEGKEATAQQQRLVEHYSGSPKDSGLFSGLLNFLVGDDPTRSYALICGNCHMHNGLARKEDFPHLTYYCPHCHALNVSQLQPEGRESGFSSGRTSPVGDGGSVSNAGDSVSETIIQEPTIGASEDN